MFIPIINLARASGILRLPGKLGNLLTEIMAKIPKFAVKALPETAPLVERFSYYVNQLAAVLKKGTDAVVEWLDEVVKGMREMVEDAWKDAKNLFKDKQLLKREQWLEDLKRNYDFNAEFEPQGIKPWTVPRNLRREMLNSFPDSILKSNKDIYLNRFIRSSRNTPNVRDIKKGKELYKIVLAGDKPGRSPYYVNMEQLEILEKSQNPEQLLGLPLTSHALSYDVFKATAISDTRIFESKIAPTKQGSYSTTGGIIQSYIPDLAGWKIELFKSFTPKI